MNQSKYFEYIEEKLNTLATRIEVRGRLNILNLHLHSEDFYLRFLNMLFNWELHNLNPVKQNVEAIDLFDLRNKIVIQVSATATKQKVESSLSKDLLSRYGNDGYFFKFISISKNANNLRKLTFKNPHNLEFSPQDDIYDVLSVLKLIMGFDIDKQREIYEFIKKELGTEIDPIKIETNLATIINILAKEAWEDDDSKFQTTLYGIDEKIEFNNLNTAKMVISDYDIYHHRITCIYDEFNKGGVNKSKSVLDSIRNIYITRKAVFNADELFFKVIEDVADKVQISANYKSIPYDELELCVRILAVDAFIRCKIFERPNGRS